MNDCTNAEMRDQLPDLLHERLDASAHAAVLAHVDGCADCRDELQLLRDVRVAIDRATPRVDINYVVGALPLPPTRERDHASRRVAARRPLWSDWRVAAAVTLIVAGGSSVALLHTNSPVNAPVRIADTSTIQAPAVTPVPAAKSNDTPVVSAPTKTRVATAAEDATPAADAADGRFSDLNEEQLKTLLGDIERLRPVPVAEPEPVMIRVSGTSSTEGV